MLLGIIAARCGPAESLDGCFPDVDQVEDFYTNAYGQVSGGRITFPPVKLGYTVLLVGLQAFGGSLL